MRGAADEAAPHYKQRIIMVFLSNLVNGLSLGSVYAIIALGYTMVYGISRMLNFAHGDVIMVGAYISFCATSYLHMPSIASVVLAIIVCTSMGIMIEGLAYRPLRGTGSLAVLITAIGVSYFLQNSALLIWGSAPKVFTSVVKGIPGLRLFNGQLTITPESILTLSACIVIMAVLTIFISRSKMGKAMRAVSEDNDAARLMGINVNNVISMTFIIGSFLAAIGSLLYFSNYPSVIPTSGAMPGLKAFVAAVFGGIGSIPGAVIGAMLIGIVENLIKGMGWTTFSDAFTFVLLIFVLLFRPTGLFGEAATDKV